MLPAILLDHGDLVAVDKPSGAVVHPSKEHRDATVILLHWLRDHVGPVSPIHRLDRPTSGVVLFARTADGVRQAQEALAQGRKAYLAAVRRVPPERGVMERPLTHLDSSVVQPALTEYERLAVFSLGETFGPAALVRALPQTGRRHQIRRHFAHEAHHLLLDTQYGKGAINRHCREALGLQRLFLHLAEIQLTLGDDTLTIRSPLPSDLQGFLERVGGPATGAW